MVTSQSIKTQGFLVHQTLWVVNRSLLVSLRSGIWSSQWANGTTNSPVSLGLINPSSSVQ